MNRKELHFLVDWKTKLDCKPLIINGARQVGKTWLVREFGKLHFKSVAYLNLESSMTGRTFWENGFDLKRILTSIEIETGEKITPGETLLILDEIQEAPNALLSLKYFYEQIPELHIISAGSLLGISLGKNSSFPVGKVEFLDLYPLTFSEYLEALSHDQLSEAIHRQDWTLLASFESKLHDLLRQYYYIGGMPEVLSSFVVDGDFEKVRTIQKNILRTYEMDFSKHAPSSIVPRIRMLWNTIPGQLAKENKKFLYKALKPGARSKDYELALHWLIDAGLVYRISNLSAIQIPLKAYEDLTAFKLFVLDTGLLGAMVDMDVRILLDDHRVMKKYKGSLTEQYVVQQMKAQGRSSIYYWAPAQSQAEVDFVFEYHSSIWPLEVKAEENLKAKSLKLFHEKYHARMAFRTSMSGYRKQEWLINIPLYGVGEIYNEAEKMESSE